MCLPRHRSAKEHVDCLSVLGTDIGSALQQWIFSPSQSPRNLFFHLGDGWPLTFKPLNHGSICGPNPCTFYYLYISFNRRRWPTSPTFLNILYPLQCRHGHVHRALRPSLARAILLVISCCIPELSHTVAPCAVNRLLNIQASRPTSTHILRPSLTCVALVLV